MTKRDILEYNILMHNYLAFSLESQRSVPKKVTANAAIYNSFLPEPLFSKDWPCDIVPANEM